MAQYTTLSQIPTAADFRAWLVTALDAVETAPASVSRATGTSVNLVREFINKEGREINLTRAALIERHLRALAAAQGFALPVITCSAAPALEVAA